MSEFRMPALGADMDRGTVVEWRVKPGDEVQRGDIVAVVATDKSDIEVETFTGGTVEEILVRPGEEVVVGSVLAHLRAPGDASIRQPPAEPATADQPALPQLPQRRPLTSIEQRPTAPPRHPAPSFALSPVVRHLAQAGGLDLANVTATGPGGVITREDVEVALAHRSAGSVMPSAEDQAPARTAGQPRWRASPRAKRLASQLGVDLAGIAGTGPGGAIVGRDLDQATMRIPAPVAATEQDRASTAERQQALATAVANLMARSKREIPHYYLSTTIDMSSALAWLAEQNSTRPVDKRLLPAALLLKAAARAALRVPTMNGYWIEDAYQPQSTVHLGVAISLRGGGLLAPTIQSADQLSVDELMDRLRELVAHARSGSLRSSEMSPPTITVTNLGEEGVECVFPVIYPPQVAMVGFGRISPRPWATQGMLGVRPVVTASLAADHRVSDGHRGARFLNLIDRLLQEPQKL
jgi:pyruvate dehydrogenase E2 component (dihydrolipoamide acetyltransferase)